MSEIFKYESTKLDRNFTLLEASAGTGKTFSIQRIVLRYVMQQGIPLQKILVVTFTRAATAELKSRIRKILAEAMVVLQKKERGEMLSGTEDTLSSLLGITEENEQLQKLRLKVALMDIDQLPVYTIDSFFNRLLKDSAFENGNLFEKELLTDASELRDEVREDFLRELLLKEEDDPEGNSLAIQKLVSNIVTGEDGNISNLFNLCDRYAEFEVVEASKVARPFHQVLSDFKTCLASFKEKWHGSFRNRLPDLISSAKGKKPKEKAFDGRNGIMRVNLELFATGIEEFLEGDASDHFESYSNKDERITKPNFLVLTGKVDPLVGDDEELKNICDELSGLIREYDNIKKALYGFAVEYFRERMSRFKNERGQIYIKDLTDMLCRTLGDDSDAGKKQALLDKVRSDYQVAIIDEFQDTSPQQCAIFRSLFESEDVGRDSAHPYPHLYVVGDPKQSIYRFRGADIYAYMGVSRNDKVRKLQLATNYRSEPAVVGGINELFQGTSAYLLLEEDVSLDVRFNDNYQADGNWVMELERPIRLVFGNNEKKVQERDLISGVSSEIVSILNDPWQYRFSRGGNTPEISRNVVPGDIAVLVRTKKEGYKMLNALARRNVPAVFQGSIPVLESDEAAAMYHLMHCMLNPKNLRLIRAFLVSALYGGASVGESDWSDASLERIASLLVEAGERWEKKGFLSAITFLEQKMDLHKKMLSRNLGERRITNFLHLAELLNHQEWSAKLPPYALLTWFGKEMSHSALSEDENSLRMEREGKAVRIITAHQCKGLEYPIVFCPFHGGNLTKKLSYTKPPFVWHEETESFGLKVAMTKEEKDEEVLNELLDDEFRLLYVAITRAKNLCYLYVPSLEGTSPVTALMEKKSPSVDNADNEKEEEDTEELGEIGRLQKWADQTRYIDFQKITVNEETYNGLNEDILIKLVEPEKLRKSYWYETRGKSSFSMITRNVDHHRDDDDQEEKSVLNDDTDEGVETSPVHKAKVSGVMLKSFIGGTKTGSLVHDTLEEILKTGWDKADSVIRRRFPVKEYSVDDQSGDKNKQIRNREDMQSMVQLLKQISLPTGSGDTVCLGYLSPAQCLPEVEFDFPFTGTKQENQNIKKALATNERLRGYADNLSNLSARPGFMNGIIDLVFEQNGKFYILDWKTNTLGDYRRAALDQAMGHSHYYLQYHIYLLALHLYLKKRMAGYEYEKHFGGVYYLFVRGMSDGTDHGVFFDRPIEATVQAMDNIWRGGING